MELCSSEYGYTVDGGDYRLIAIESFTAYAMDVHVIGKSIHPGSAKNKLVNASEVLMRFHEALPHALRRNIPKARNRSITSVPSMAARIPPPANISSVLSRRIR